MRKHFVKLEVLIKSNDMYLFKSTHFSGAFIYLSEGNSNFVVYHKRAINAVYIKHIYTDTNSNT